MPTLSPRLLKIGQVVITCRRYEFENYFEDARQSALRIAHQLTRVDLPKLAPQDIIAWAKLYLSASKQAQTQEEAGFLLALEGGVEKNGSLSQVCAVPIRLAITCEIFASFGHVPEDLTVTGLYNAYWDTRIRRHAGMGGTQASYAKERAALGIASHVVSPSGRILLKIPKGRVSDDVIDGVRLLESEGVLRDLRTSWEFFHQTFAEYAYAQWLLMKGIDSDEVTNISQRLQLGQTSLWPIAGSLLLQVTDYCDYLNLLDILPLLGPEGAYTHALAALRRSEAEALDWIIGEVQQDTDLMSAILPVLSDAPVEHLDIAFNASLAALRNHPTRLAGQAASTLGVLLTRVAPVKAASLLSTALTALAEVRPKLSPRSWEHVPATLLAPLVDSSATNELLPIMCESYTMLGVPGRQLVIQAYLYHSMSEEQVGDFARRVLGVPCPPLRGDHPVQLLQLLWNCPAVRQDRSWHSWRELLSDDLPAGWIDIQLKYVIHLADQHVGVRTEILNDLIAGDVQKPVSHVTVFKELAALHPIWIADWLLGHAAPTERLAIGGVAQGAEGLARGTDSATRMQLIAWLTPGRHAAPRSVWAAQIILAGGSMPAHQQIFDDLISAGELRQVIDSAIDTWLFQTPRHVLNELTSQLRLLLQDPDPETRRTRARLRAGSPMRMKLLVDGWNTRS